MLTYEIVTMSYNKKNIYRKISIGNIIIYNIIHGWDIPSVIDEHNVLDTRVVAHYYI